MTARFSFSFFMACGFAAVISLAGCNKSVDDPSEDGSTTTAEADAGIDPHDVPVTDQQMAELRSQTAQFADAVATIKRFRDQIEQETLAGIPTNPFNAHQALDKADLVLQWLPEVARDSQVAKENWETVNTAANDLRTLFEQVHQNIDEKQDPNFAAVASAIDQQLATLEQITTTPSSDADDAG